ncbi:MAG: hypothetical protein IPN38_08295 [Flavobacteriales bacterium]|nr:hypothetical protein [Flavobacteriales bacterium]
MINALAVITVLALVGVAYWLVPMIQRLTEHRSVAAATVRATTMNADVNGLAAVLDFSNSGDRPYTIVAVNTRFPDEQGVMQDRTSEQVLEGRSVTVEGHGVASVTVLLARCPASVSEPESTIIVRHFDGSIEKLVVKSGTRNSCGPSTKEEASLATLPAFPKPTFAFARPLQPA